MLLHAACLERFVFAASLERVPPTSDFGMICCMQRCWGDLAEGCSFFLEFVVVLSHLISHLVAYLLTESLTHLILFYINIESSYEMWCAHDILCIVHVFMMLEMFCLVCCKGFAVSGVATLCPNQCSWKDGLEPEI